jgi:hypothetical protein
MSHDKDQRVYGFSKSGHSRVSQAVRYVEKHRGGVGNEGMPSVRSSSPVTVKVTELPGTDPELDPLYHVGVFTHWSDSEEDWEDSEEKCYVFQESFDDLVVGTRYPGQVVDNHDHGAVVVMASVGGGGTIEGEEIEVVINVAVSCNGDGTITVTQTKQDIIVIDADPP